MQKRHAAIPRLQDAQRALLDTQWVENIDAAGFQLLINPDAAIDASRRAGRCENLKKRRDRIRALNPLLIVDAPAPVI